ncbi:MAG: hypothetical protein JSU73_01070 [candidate division WOR-3 bacterium]|nr:MAG: hypothetical protein JSU73_01070 [candidate division WOR-3 bacterium]
MKLLVLIAVLAATALAAEWDPETRLTDNSWPDYNFWSGQRRVAVDQAGRVHTVWYVMNSGLGTYRFQVYYKRFVPGSGWTADTMISADLYAESTFCKYPGVAVDSSGRVFAVWGAGSTDEGDDRVYVKTCLPEGSGNGGWDEASTELSTSGPSQEKACPNLAATPDGHVHAVWLETTTIVYRECIDSVWQGEVRLESGTGYKAYPVVAGGRDNTVHLGWYGRLGGSGFYDVWYKSRTDTTWNPTEEVSQGQRHQMYPSIAVNPVTGNPHMLWQCYEPTGNTRRVVHAWRTGSGWQPRDTVSEPGSEHEQGTGQLVFTQDGRGHAVWAGRSDAWPNVNQIRYSERDANGDWSAAVNVTDTSNTRERPSICGGSDSLPNDLHMVWTDYRMGNSEVYYAHANPSPQPVKERRRRTACSSQLTASLVRGSLMLPGRQEAMLLDAAGSRVIGLHPGENPVSRLAPGVYFVLSAAGGGRPAVEVRRVVVTR